MRRRCSGLAAVAEGGEVCEAAEEPWGSAGHGGDGAVGASHGSACRRRGKRDEYCLGRPGVWAVRIHLAELPVSGAAFEFVWTAAVEVDPGSVDEVALRAGD